MYDGEDPLLVQQQRQSAVNARFAKFMFRMKLWMAAMMLAALFCFELHDFLLRNLPKHAVNLIYLLFSLFRLAFLGRRAILERRFPRCGIR